MPSHANTQVKFGQIIRQLRLKRGLSQEDMAALAGIHRNYWSGIERGERNVSLSKILAIAAALQVKPAKLFAKF
ncbi:MAG: helix-turn-helix transcriptional regulator [Terriglobales bacterium]